MPAGALRGYVILQYNQFGNAVRATAVRDACEQTNGRVGFAIWMTRNFTAAEARAAVIASGARGFVAEAEIPAQHPDGSPNAQAQDWPALVAALADLGVDCAVATSWAPFQVWSQGRTLPAAELAAPLIKAGWYVMPYVYPAENPSDTVASQVDYARHFTHEARPDVLSPGENWYDPEPVLGCYQGKTLDSSEFAGWESCASISIWDAGDNA